MFQSVKNEFWMDFSSDNENWKIYIGETLKSIKYSDAWDQVRIDLK